MMNLPRKLNMQVGAALEMGGSIQLGIRKENHYKIECLKPDGTIRWVMEFDNLVVDEGINDSLDKHMKGSAYTAAWYVFLMNSTPSVAAGDTMASHAGWAENTDYSNANRPTLTLGAVSGKSVNNSASKAVFNINATTTIGGAGLCNNNTKGGATGILYGGGAFAANRNAISGDTLNVTVTCTGS